MSRLMFTGSDVLFATRLVGGKKFPTRKTKFAYMLAYTIFIKICDFFVEGFYVVSEHLIDELKPLKLKSEIKVLVDPPLFNGNVRKIPHEGFNVLYYRGLGSNQVFKDWVYGYDIISEVIVELSKEYSVNHLQNHAYYTGFDINIIEVNGKADMSRIYPYADVLIRPNRHDGYPRMVIECDRIGIPYYWSKENPSVKEIIKYIKNVKNTDSV